MATSTLKVVPLRTDGRPALVVAHSRPAGADGLATADDERLARARGGDGVAFAEILRRYQGSVFSIAWRMLGQRDQAEELAQDVFLQLHRNLGTIESADHLRFWLRRVVCHRAIDRARQRARQPMTALQDVPEPASLGDQHDPILRRRLKAAIATLSSAARSVVLLRYQEDLDPTEIARVLDMPLNTVKSHLKRSLAALRRQWGGTQVGR